MESSLNAKVDGVTRILRIIADTRKRNTKHGTRGGPLEEVGQGWFL